MITRKRLSAVALSATALSAVLGVAVAAPAAAQQPVYPPTQDEDGDGVDDDADDDDDEVEGGDSDDGPEITVSDVVVQPGSPVAVSAPSGCLPGSTVDVVLLRLGSDPEVLSSTSADASGGFALSAPVPGDATRGVYVLYTRCVDESGRIVISSLAFVVVPAGTEGRNDDGGAESSDGGIDSSSGGGTTNGSAVRSAAAVRSAGLSAADVPAAWTAPAGWAADAAEREAVSQAVNAELAALRTELLPSGATASGVSATDIAPWAAAGVASAFLLGAAGYRRRSHDSDEVSA